jgi:hypothetical protein
VLYQHHQNGVTQPLIHEELVERALLTYLNSRRGRA